MTQDFKSKVARYTLIVGVITATLTMLEKGLEIAVSLGYHPFKQ